MLERSNDCFECWQTIGKWLFCLQTIHCVCYTVAKAEIQDTAAYDFPDTPVKYRGYSFRFAKRLAGACLRYAETKRFPDFDVHQYRQW